MLQASARKLSRTSKIEYNGTYTAVQYSKYRRGEMQSPAMTNQEAYSRQKARVLADYHLLPRHRIFWIPSTET